VEISSQGFERDAVRRAVAWFPKSELKSLVALFTGSAAFTESVFSGLSVPVGGEISWREEVRRLFAQACTGRSIRAPWSIQHTDTILQQLSEGVRPTQADIELVCNVARQFSIAAEARRSVLNSPSHREGLVWQMVGNKVRLRRKRGAGTPWASEIIMHFEDEEWNRGLPSVDAIQFSRDLESNLELVLPVYHVSEFKGLESASVLLYIHNLGAMPEEELLVAVSRARLFLAIVIDSHAETTMPISIRRLLREYISRSLIASKDTADPKSYRPRLKRS
jgi:hypothetical protein